MTERPIPAPAIAAAVELAQLFERELALALNEAQRRLLDGDDRLAAGLSAEALRGIYGPAGPDLGLSGRRAPVLEAEHPIAALQEVADTVGRAFIDYQNAAEERRRLGLDVGEANARLVAAMTAAGFAGHEARGADVRGLAEGVYRAAWEER